MMRAARDPSGTAARCKVSNATPKPARAGTAFANTAAVAGPPTRRCRMSMMLPAAATSASAGEHRCLMQKGVIADLFDEEIRHVGARDEPVFPVAWIDRRAIGVRLRPIG